MAAQCQAGLANRGLHLSLRIACAMCFIGHGSWGVITKAEWLIFFDTGRLSSVCRPIEQPHGHVRAVRDAP